MKFWKRLRRRVREHRTVVGILALAGLAAFTGWRRLDTPSPGPSALPPAAAMGVDYSLERFVLTMLDESGRSGLSLTGVSLEHVPQTKRSRIEAPDTSVRAGDARWHGSAARGWVNDEGTQVQLTGNVKLSRLESEGITPLELQTEELTLYPERDRASTPALVTLIQPGARLQGEGMLVDLARGYYELDARVRGRYDVPDSN